MPGKKRSVSPVKAKNTRARKEDPAEDVDADDDHALLAEYMAIAASEHANHPAPTVEEKRAIKGLRQMRVEARNGTPAANNGLIIVDHQVTDALWQVSKEFSSLNLNHGQDTRANRTRHVLFFSRQGACAPCIHVAHLTPRTPTHANSRRPPSCLLLLGRHVGGSSSPSSSTHTLGRLSAALQRITEDPRRIPPQVGSS